MNGVLHLLKIFGILALGVAVGAVGFVYYDRLIHRRRYLEKLTLFAATCANTMRCTHRSVFEIFKENGIKELKFLQRINKTNLTERTAVSELLIAADVASSDRAVVTDFVVDLSVGDIKELTAHCEYYRLKFEQMLGVAEKDVGEKGRLFRSLFVLAGVALFIILI